MERLDRTVQQVAEDNLNKTKQIGVTSVTVALLPGVFSFFLLLSVVDSCCLDAKMLVFILLTGVVCAMSEVG